MTCLRIAVASAAALCAFALGGTNPTASPSSDKLWEYRNLGKAFYENPDTHVQAVEALHNALLLAPDSTREHINYGLALLRAGKNAEAVTELTNAQKQDPSLPHTWFNLAIYYKHNADYVHAIEQLQGMIKLTPDEPVPHYNLGSVLRSKGDTDGALPEFLKAEELNPYLAGPHFQLFTIYQRKGDRENATRERTLFEEAKKRNEGLAVPEDMEWCFFAELYDPADVRSSAAVAQKYADHLISKGWDTATTGMRAIDIDGKGHADLLVWSAQQVALYKNGSVQVHDPALDALKDVRSIAVGDYDNDGLPDLCVLTKSGASLLHNDGGRFSHAKDLPNTSGATVAFWHDFDHDNDIDLFLFGPQSVLMRNNGDGSWEDHSADFPFVRAQATDAVPFAVRSDAAARDLIVSYADHAAVLYRDQLNQHFAPVDISGLGPGASLLSTQDFNHDGELDLVAYSPHLCLLENHDGILKPVSTRTKDVAAPAPSMADFSGDRRGDYASITGNGELHLFSNDSSEGSWSTAHIVGIKNLKLAPGATVEMKSGPYYEKRIYDGVPLAFATDGHADVDTVRITWPNGLIQNEVHQKTGQAWNIEEAQRLSGSCPMIFTWNGHGFEFITDVLGVAPLGASSGDGHYFPVDHDEYIQIPGSALHAVNGHYQVHITEELHEVSYLDKVQLIAVDHPKGEQIYTNDKFKSPPYPAFRLFGGSKIVHPQRATEGDGSDATRQVSEEDRVYPTAFPHNHDGVAAMHTLDLDFGSAAASNQAALVLNGWVDWADGSTFLGASQSGTGLVFPYLQVKNAAGDWQTVVPDMGIPSGKPKTMVVDLTGKFLSASRQVRIVTNLCVYWDKIALLETSASPTVDMTNLDATKAQLAFRGFSRAVVDPNRQQPEQFRYEQVQATSNWNPTAGYYTRYGDVTPLVTTIDDRLTVMGSGDELQLDYDATHLPGLKPGWSRDFLLLVDGWAKDADANTAFSQTVAPLPFHGMSAYPYKATEHFPNDGAHQRYLRDYQTRPALQLIRPLIAQAAEPKR